MISHAVERLYDKYLTSKQEPSVFWMLITGKLGANLESVVLRGLETGEL